MAADAQAEQGLLMTVDESDLIRDDGEDEEFGRFVAGHKRPCRLLGTKYAFLATVAVVLAVVSAAVVAGLALLSNPSFLRRGRWTGDRSSQPVLLISMDGFRASYLDRNLTPFLSSIANDTGLRAEYLISQFPVSRHNTLLP